jgi:RarD protein
LWFIVGFVISITGVTFVCLNGNRTLEFNPKGDFLALFSAICWGFYSVVISIINRKNYDQICATRRIFFFAVLMMIPLMIFTKQNDILENIARFKNPLNDIYLLFLGLVASGFCFAAWNKACKTVGTVKVSCGLYLIPLVTIIFAFFVLGEKISLLGALGAAITITGLFISEK